VLIDTVHLYVQIAVPKPYVTAIDFHQCYGALQRIGDEPDHVLACTTAVMCL